MTLDTHFPASSFTPVPMPMIWNNRIPAATVTVIAGPPGLGKSTLSTKIAADLSKVGHRVLISNTEDDPSSVTRPRLEVADANLDNVFIIPEESAPILPRDLEALGEVLMEVEPAALFIDPAEAHFVPSTKLHDRPTLRGLIRLARTTKTAIVCMHHTTKTWHDAVGSVGGPSGGLGGTARAVYLYGYDPDDEDRRALACAKINGVDRPATLIVEHETVDLAAGDRLIEVGKVKFREETSADARSVLKKARNNKRRDEEAAEWLTLYLARGDNAERKTMDVRQEASKQKIPYARLLRVRADVGVENVRVGWGGDGYWLWRLPLDHPLRDGSPGSVE